MSRFILAALVAAMLAGCVGDPNPSGANHHKPPPQDPADYHGVPTDMTPPSMLEAPAGPAAPASQ
ncbi:hypothetical protein [Burkholderia gladioli]|jgi:PBP1b-binding outer membrane lipoprotein LpoB|uniref:hypothetical protein n=1 Tax=Burkholderia gladioli TaxID=28095 RepID=UPI000F52D025|nr:hypothetical protein [Burkholderia gladioli]